MDTSPEDYERHLTNLRKLARDQGVERLLKEYGVDVILGPTDSGLTSMASAGGKYLTSLYREPVSNANLCLIQAFHFVQCHYHIWTTTAGRLASRQSQAETRRLF